MVDFNKAHQMTNSWVRAFKSECEDQFGKDEANRR